MSERLAAKTGETIVVFNIGLRINRWWKPWVVIKIARQMGAMQAELRTQDLGCLNIQNWGGRITISVQHWRSFEALEAYAHASTHLKAWRAYAANGDVGVWHESYEVSAYEAVYVAMEPILLGAAVGTVEAKGAMKTARKRIEASSK